MPIYAYRCAACGHARDMLQKISDPVLTDCPACGAASFQKQLTAAGFQLKGSGWYVTDFRNGGGSNGSASAGSTPAKPDAPAAPAQGGDTPAKSDSGAASAAAPAAAGGCGSSCACH